MKALILVGLSLCFLCISTWAVDPRLKQKFGQHAAIPVRYSCATQARKDLLKDCKDYVGHCDASQCAKKCTGYSCMSATVKTECLKYCDPAIMKKSGCTAATKPNARDYAHHLSICELPYPLPKDPIDYIPDPESSIECKAACTAYCAPFLCSLDNGIKNKCEEFCSDFKYTNHRCQEAKPGPC